MKHRAVGGSSRWLVGLRSVLATGCVLLPSCASPAGDTEARLDAYLREELRDELRAASAPVFVDAQELGSGKACAFGTPIRCNAFYRTGGDRPRFWAVSFDADDRVAYLELEE